MDSGSPWLQSRGFWPPPLDGRRTQLHPRPPRGGMESALKGSGARNYWLLPEWIGPLPTVPQWLPQGEEPQKQPSAPGPTITPSPQLGPKGQSHRALERASVKLCGHHLRIRRLRWGSQCPSELLLPPSPISQVPPPHSPVFLSLLVVLWKRRDASSVLQDSQPQPCRPPAFPPHHSPVQSPPHWDINR